MRDLRVPRSLLGLIVGAALGGAGALMQGATRNAFAEVRAAVTEGDRL